MHRVTSLLHLVLMRRIHLEINRCRKTSLMRTITSSVPLVMNALQILSMARRRENLQHPAKTVGTEEHILRKKYVPVCELAGWM